MRIAATGLTEIAFIRNLPTLNLLDFGADPYGIRNSAPALKRARDKLETDSAYRGGTIFAPPGNYKINETIAFTKYAIDPVHNTWLVGAGPLATTFDFSGAPAGSDGLKWGAGAHFGGSGFMITGAPRHGLVVGGDTGENAARFNFHDIRIQNCGGDGLYSKNAFTGAFRNMWIRENAGYGVNFAGFHTSITAEAVAALSNDLAGFHLDAMCYSSFISCASDQNEYGYSLSNLNAVSFVGCGTESNVKDGWLLRASDALSSGVLTEVQNIKSVSFLNCFNFANGKAASGTYATFINALTANSRPIEISIDGCTSWRNHSSDNSIIANGASGTIKINERMASYDGSVSASGTVRWIGRRFSLTPTIYGTTSAGTGTYTNQSGSYQFISDDEIVFDLRVDWSAHTGTGNLTVATGLPFNAVGNYPVTIYYSSLDYVVAPSMGVLQNNSKDIILVYPADNAGNTITPIDGAAQVIISGRYRMAA